MPLNEVHTRVGNSLILFMLALGIWALGLYALKREVSPGYLGALLIGETLAVVQASIGVFMWITGTELAHPDRLWLHILYGAVSVIMIPFVYFYTGSRTTRREALIYGLLCLFLFGIGLRANFTGREIAGF